jgi:hypothetical protein
MNAKTSTAMRNVTTWTCGIGLRLRNLLTKRISWTSGEADNPGPTHFIPQYDQSQDNEKTHNHSDHRDAHVNDVRFRFHNVQGLRDPRFRAYYLRRASTTCEILALAETNCLSESEGKWWSRDWLGNAGCFWAPAPSPPQGRNANTCRGMAILFSSNLGDVKASELWRDPEGRGLAVKACIHGHNTVIIAFHADCSSEEAQEISYHKLRRHVPMLPHHHYIWMLDANNVVNLRLDAKTVRIRLRLFTVCAFNAQACLRSGATAAGPTTHTHCFAKVDKDEKLHTLVSHKFQTHTRGGHRRSRIPFCGTIRTLPPTPSG